MLRDHHGYRKYLTPNEREAFLRAAEAGEGRTATFCLLIGYTGCRISEALQLTAGQVDRSEGVVVFRSLKKRRSDVFRAVPVPDQLLRRVDRVHELKRCASTERLWPWSRTTGWSQIKSTMVLASVVGRHACPKGLRHGFGIAATQRGVPLNIVQRWLGHADISTTAIYADAVGEEERALASRLWGSEAA